MVDAKAMNQEVKVAAQDVHRWLQEMGWSAPSQRSKYPSKYRFNPGTRERFKLIVGEYCRMEEEKDDRQYGSLSDSLARLEAGRRVEPRWAEMMKFVSNFLEMGEYASIAGSALLYDSAGLRQGVLIVSDCRSCTCGACRAYLAEGTYDQLLTHSVHALSDEDEEQGWVLSCRLRPRADLVLEFDYPADRVTRLSAVHRTARVLGWEQCGGGLFHLSVRTVAVHSPLAWAAGQHVLIRHTQSGRVYPAFPADSADGGLEIDLYLAMPRGLRLGAPLFTEGEMVTLEGPFGDFTLSPESQDAIFLAGEEGLPPAVAMFSALSRQAQKRNATLIGFDIGGEAESWLRPLAGAHPVLRFSPDTLTERVAASRSVQLYLCGPAELNAAARSVLVARDAENVVVWENDMFRKETQA